MPTPMPTAMFSISRTLYPLVTTSIPGGFVFPEFPAKLDCIFAELVRANKPQLRGVNQVRGHKLSRFHYRGHKIAGPRSIFRMMRGDELCGVIVYCYPPPTCYGRRLALPHMSMRELNEKLSIINHVVIHPKYRTIGLGAKIIRETLPLAGTPCVEMVAVMAKYNPFAEKAGLKKIAEQQPLPSILRISEVLGKLGFAMQLLGSERDVLGRVKTLSASEMEQMKEVFIENKHPRFKKEFAVSRHQPFGKTSDYVECIEKADHEKLTKLVKLVGMLLQTKTYLFWRERAS